MEPQESLHIDHVEFTVPDQRAAAAWFDDVLGLRPVTTMMQSVSISGGPLMLSGDGGSTKIALFQGEVPKPMRGNFTRLALRVGGERFIAILQRLRSGCAFNEKGETLTTPRFRDHTYAFSVYFCDPHGYPFEVTTYDYDFIQQWIQDGA